MAHDASRRSRRRRLLGGISIVLVVCLPSSVEADEPQVQIWGNLTLDGIKSRQLTFGVDIEPKVLVSKPSDDPGWATLDVTPSLEYSRGNWFDMIGETLVARTKQTDDENSTEITPRIGFRFHILSNLENDFLKEKLPKRRLVVRDLIRLEWRNLYYSTDKPNSSSLRLRNRVEMSYPMNRRRLTDDGATYVTGDAEWFWTEEDPDERFASKQRVRVGLGHRRSRPWRFEALFIWDRSRNSAAAGFTTSDYAVDVRVRRVW
jgi:hypothetical protein